MVFIVQAYQTSQYVVPRGGIFLCKWRSSFAGSSDGKMNVQSACALNTRYIPHPPHSPLSNRPTSIWGRVHIIKLLIMQVSRSFYCFYSLKFKYSHQHPIYKQNQCPSVWAKDQVSHSYNTAGQITDFYILIFTWKWKTEDPELNGGKHSRNLITKAMRLCLTFKSS
jgi:hypothetical protein